MRISIFFIAILTPILLCVLGCRKALDHPNPTEESRANSVQLTVWTDRYEVFVDHRPPVANKATTFTTHITDLQTLQPRREGTVQLLLRQGDLVTEHFHGGPARPGIYLPGVFFPRPGDWQVTLLIPTSGTNAVVEFGTVKVHADERAAQRAKIADTPEGVNFAKEQQWKIGMRTSPVTQRQLAKRIPLPARVRAKPGTSASITAPMSGQLVVASNTVLPQPGTRVDAGQVLALLQPSFSEVGAKALEARAEFVSAKAILEQSERAYHRTRKLADEQAKSPRELQEAELALQSAQARYSTAARLLATLTREGGAASLDAPLLVELRTPIAGVLNSVAAGPGEGVAAQQPIFQVLNLESVWIEAQIPEARLAEFQLPQNALAELPGWPRRFIPITGEGRGGLISLSLEVDATSRTVPLLFETQNRESQFRMGQFLTLHVDAAQADRTIAVPESALVDEGEQVVAFVQVGGESFEKRPVKAGFRDGDYVQVLEGIKEGERVVVEGAYALRLASLSGAIPEHGHIH